MDDSNLNLKNIKERQILVIKGALIIDFDLIYFLYGLAFSFTKHDEF